MVAGCLRREDWDGYDGDHERDAAVEATCLRVRPWIHRPNHLPAVVGVRAVGLREAVVAYMGPPAVAHQATLVVRLTSEEELILGTDPGVVRVMIGEAGCPVALRADVRVAREEVESEGYAEQEDGVARREKYLRVDHPTPSVRLALALVYRR